MKELTVPERKVLEIIVLTFAEEPFTVEALERNAPGRITGFEAELAIERLRERGIVETRRKSWGETFHMLAPGLFTDWQPCFIQGWPDAVVAEEDVTPSCEPKAGFAKLLMYLVSEAANYGITLTQKGSFHKKEIARLAARIDIDVNVLEGLSVSYLHQDKLPKPIAVLYDAALRLGLLNPGTGKIHVSQARLADWLDRSLHEADRALQALWWDVYIPSDVWLQHGAAAIRRLPPGQWCSLRSLTKLLLTAGASTAGRTEADAMTALYSYWIAPMAAFGWLELGTAEGETAFRYPETTGDNGEDEGWYVQPDLELIVPPAVPLCARWELEACADYMGGDTVDRYRITKASWERALEGGRVGTELIEVLKEFAAYGMPESVESILREWSNAYGALTLEEVTLLRCRAAADAEYLKSEPSVADCIIAQVGELDFIVNPAKAQSLAEKLKRQGFSLRTGAVPGHTASAANGDDEQSSNPGTNGIMYSRRSATLFPIDPSPAGTERLREQLQRIPQTWLRAFRKYHATTARELMETAIDLRTSVRCLVSSQPVEFVPKRLSQSGSEWIAEGYIEGKEARVSSVQCGEAQILLPEQA